MKKKIYIITGRDKFIGQFRKPWVSLEAGVFYEELTGSGWQVEFCEFHQVANEEVKIEDSYVYYTFSQKDEFRQYIKDIIYFLQQKNNKIIPPYDLLLCHEDKGWQELYKRILGIKLLPSLFLSDIRELSSYNIKYPVIVKTLTGSNSKGVFLAENEKELRKIVRSFTPDISLPQKIDLLRRKYFRRKKKVKGWQEFQPHRDYLQYKEYITPSRNFIIQKFIPGLQHDFRVLYVAGHYYVTKRHVRRGDFRASGAKLFDFETGDVKPLLDFTRNLINKFDIPYLSIDLVKDKDEIHLLEFQANHFGNNVIKLSAGYYKEQESNWAFNHEKPDVSRVLAQGLARYMRKYLPE